MHATSRQGTRPDPPLSVRPGVLLAVGLLTVVAGVAILPTDVPDHTPLAYLTGALITGATLLGALTLAELAAAAASRRAGYTVTRIEVGLVGAGSRPTGEPVGPGRLALAAAAGPLALAALSAALLGIASGLNALGTAALLASGFGWCGLMGLVLAGVSLLPGSPLPGGRVVQAALWKRTGDLGAAQVAAAGAGRGVGVALVAVGVVELLFGRLAGLWLILLGWLLFAAATVERAGHAARRALRGVRVADVMTPQPATGPAWLTVEAFLERVALTRRHGAFPLVEHDGTAAGLVTLHQLSAVAPDDRGLTRVSRVATPLAQVPTARPEEPVSDLLARMGEHAATVGRALVLDARGQVAGIVTAVDIRRALELAPLRSTTGPAGVPAALPPDEDARRTGPADRPTAAV